MLWPLASARGGSIKHHIVRVDTPEIHLYPLSDIQIGAPGVDKDGFRAHVERAMRDPLARFYGGGDYTDGVSPSNRRFLQAGFIRGDIYDTVQEMLTDAAKKQASEFLELVRGTAGKWDFLLKGHHLYPYAVPQENGTHVLRTTDHDIADALNAPYFGDPTDKIGQAMVSYVFPPPSRGRKRPVLRLYATHGQGGGATLGAPLNKLEKMMRGFSADIFYIAHYHRVLMTKVPKLHEDEDARTNLRATDSLLVSGGSWMRGYMPDTVTYAEDGMMAPLAIGAPKIYVRARPNGTFDIEGII